MAKFMIVVGFCMLGVSFAMPASNEQLDKATVNDVLVNAVAEENKPDFTAVVQPQQNLQVVPSTVEISGITTGLNAPPSPPSQENGGFKPQRAGSMFARLIDDIFQIPIAVLQNVARLITNPFTQAKKDPTVTATIS